MKDKSKRNKKNKKLSNKKKMVLILSTIIVVCLCGVGIFYGYVRNSIYEKTKDDISGVDIQGDMKATEEEPMYEEQEGITNILLIGVDARKGDKKSRSDSMIIATIDNNNKNVKLTTIMRDTYVKVPGLWEQKINASHAWGGPELLMKTIEKNFKINIDKYVVVDFYGFIDLINAIDGIDVEIKDYEIKEINKYIRETEREKAIYIKEPGVNHLNGSQVLAYTRIRYVGNNDYERTERQRKVISLILDKLKDTKVINYPKMLTSVLPYIKTNIEPAKFLSYGYTVSKFKPLEIQQLQIPMNEISESRRYEGTYVLLMDKDQNAKVLNNFIFNNKITDKSELDLYSFRRILEEYERQEKKPEVSEEEDSINEDEIEQEDGSSSEVKKPDGEESQEDEETPGEEEAPSDEQTSSDDEATSGEETQNAGDNQNGSEDESEDDVETQDGEETSADEENSDEGSKPDDGGNPDDGQTSTQTTENVENKQ